jgi:hypothetical protein
MHPNKRCPVLARYAVIRKIGRIVSFVAHESSRIATVFAEQTRGIVFRVSLNENELAPVFFSCRHAPSSHVGVDDNVVAGVFEGLSGHRIPARVRKEDLRFESGGEFFVGVDVL